METPITPASAPPSVSGGDATPTFKAVATNAIRYWEVRRVAYNLVLFLIVAGYYLTASANSKKEFSVDLFLFLLVLAVLANLCYTAAYVVDVFAQFSGLREMWLRYRWILFLIGLGFAGILTRFFSMGFFHRY